MPLTMMGNDVTLQSHGKSLAKLLLRSRSAREGERVGSVLVSRTSSFKNA
jgi:hypothetical protein